MAPIFENHLQRIPDHASCPQSIARGTCENGNKELTTAEALVNIGVFNDNRAVFDHGIRMWRGRAPAYTYLKTDGPRPVDQPGCGPALWGNKGFTPVFTDGLLQETARDSGHVNMALASAGSRSAFPNRGDIAGLR